MRHGQRLVETILQQIGPRQPGPRPPERNGRRQAGCERVWLLRRGILAADPIRRCFELLDQGCKGGNGLVQPVHADQERALQDAGRRVGGIGGEGLIVASKCVCSLARALVRLAERGEGLRVVRTLRHDLLISEDRRIVLAGVEQRLGDDVRLLFRIERQAAAVDRQPIVDTPNGEIGVGQILHRGGMVLALCNGGLQEGDGIDSPTRVEQQPAEGGLSGHIVGRQCQRTTQGRFGLARLALLVV